MTGVLRRRGREPGLLTQRQRHSEKVAMGKAGRGVRRSQTYYYLQLGCLASRL